MANSYTSNTKFAKPAAGDFDWDDEVNGNQDGSDFVLSGLKSKNRIISGLLVTDGGSLDADYTTGVVDAAGSRYTPAASSVLLTASSLNWIYVNSSGVVTTSTTVPTGDFAPMARADTDATSILRIADLRTFGYQDLQLDNGVKIDEFSSDGTMAGNSDLAVPTEKAILTYLANTLYIPNILINPDFGVNNDVYTFGTAIGTANTYLLDGWLSDNTDGKIADNGDGTFTVTNLLQILYRYNDGVTVTISANVTDANTITVSHGGANSKSDIGTLTGVGTISSSTTSITFTLDVGVKTYPVIKLNGTAKFNSLKLEISSVQTPYIAPTFADNLFDCQETFYKSYNHSVAPGSITNNGAFQRYVGTTGTFKVNFNVRMPRSMRVTPTITPYSNNTGTSGKMYSTAMAADVTATSAVPGENSFVIVNSGTITTVGGAQCHFTCDARP